MKRTEAKPFSRLPAAGAMSENAAGHGRRLPAGHDFSGRLVGGLMQVMERTLNAELTGARDGYLQGLDPRVKLVGLFVLIMSTVLAKSLWTLAALFLLGLVLAYFSGITKKQLFKQVWISVLLFSGLVALPASVIVPGDPVLTLPLLCRVVTSQGLRSAALLIGRAETSATLALLLILTTPWPHVLKAMRTLGVPVVVVAMLGMTHRYIFVLLQTAAQMFEARRSRLVAPACHAQRRRIVMAATGVLLGKAFQLSSDVHLAMVSRGYRGEIHLLDDFRARARDWVALFLALTVPTLILWQQQ